MNCERQAKSGSTDCRLPTMLANNKGDPFYGRVKVNPKFYRPTEVDQLLGDPSKARSKLGWVPRVSFPDLVKDMMQADVKLMKEDPNA